MRIYHIFIGEARALVTFILVEIDSKILCRNASECQRVADALCPSHRFVTFSVNKKEIVLKSNTEVQVHTYELNTHKKSTAILSMT